MKIQETKLKQNKRLEEVCSENGIDFISLNIGARSNVVLNMADIFQWAGYICMLVGLYIDFQYYWPNRDLRNRFFVNANFQIRTGVFMGLFTLMIGVTLLVFGVFIFTG